MENYQVPSTTLLMGCTTIPSRARFLPNVIEQAKKQTLKPDIFCIGIPLYSTREKAVYDLDVIDEIAHRYTKEKDGFDVFISILDQDYGPLCKLAGMLAIAPESSLMITIDDDHIYDEKLVQTLVDAHYKFSGSCICLCGHALGRLLPKVHAWGYRQTGFDGVPILNALQLDHGAPVDIISGWAGVLYSRYMFGPPWTGLHLPDDLEFYRKTDAIKGLHKNDDLYISAWLSSINVNRVVVKYKGKYEQRQAKEIGSINPLCHDGHKNWLKGHLVHFNSWWKLINQLESKGYFEDSTSVPPNKSILLAGAGFVGLIGLAITGSLVYMKKK